VERWDRRFSTFDGSARDKTAATWMPRLGEETDGLSAGVDGTGRARPFVESLHDASSKLHRIADAGIDGVEVDQAASERTARRLKI